MIYFYADPHFFHGNIIRYCNRPFTDSKNMNKELIKRYNEKINSDDVVYFIGDVSLNKIHDLERIIPKLSGIKHLILGNHDRCKPFDYIDIGFTSVHTSLEITYTDDRQRSFPFILVHDPCTSCIDRKKWFICGHTHDLFKICQNVVSACVENWNYAPVSANEIVKLIDSHWIKDLNEKC